MSSYVHFTIGLQKFIYHRTLEKKKERIQQRRPPTAVVQHLAFFFYTATHLIVMM